MRHIDNNKVDKYNILILQDAILDIALYIHNFCKKHNVEYCLMGGSALGALRHHGFIPWDDDLDIFMTPENYARFRQLFRIEGDHSKFHLQEMGQNSSSMIASAKLRANNTAYIESAFSDMHIHHGIFVDIFILHNCPRAKWKQLLMVGAAKYLLLKGQSYKKVSYKGLKGVLLHCVRLLPKNFLYRQALSMLYHYDDKESELVCHLLGKAFYKKGIYRKKYFERSLCVPFEKVYLNIPVGAHEYLTERFGDYLKIPSEDSIKNAQHTNLWSSTEDFSCYTNTNRLFDEEWKLI